MRNKSKKIAFTLVEMLIVVVIIWILAAALIPRLTWAQERSRDAARKAHLNQLVAALSTYNSENGQFPGTWWTTKDANDLTGILIPNFIKTMPSDPQVNRVFSFAGNATTCLSTAPWNYGYSPLTRNWAPLAGMIVWANVETPWKNNSNYVIWTWYSGSIPTWLNTQWCINWVAADAVDLELYFCKTWVKIDKADSNKMWTWVTDCVAKSATNLMYVMIQ